MPVGFTPSLEQSLQRAGAIAREQGRAYTTPEDLLIGLIDDVHASALMQALRIDCDRLRRDIANHMDQATDQPQGDSSEVPKHTPELHSVMQLAATHVQSAGRTAVTGADILVQLFTQPVGHFLEQQGVTRYEAVTQLSHGAPAEAMAAPDTSGAARLEVFLLNDDYTPMEFVVWILEEVFGIGRDDATKIMLATHHNGRGSCGAFARAEATERVVRVEKLANEHRHPLRCLMLPAAEPAAP
jgi:ATP-dependent Clp protease ATP-binding subunit ClpA